MLYLIAYVQCVGCIPTDFGKYVKVEVYLWHVLVNSL